MNGLDEISRFVTDDLGYVVRVERGQSRIDGSTAPIPFALRVTIILQRSGSS